MPGYCSTLCYAIHRRDTIIEVLSEEVAALRAAAHTYGDLHGDRSPTATTAACGAADAGSIPAGHTATNIGVAQRIERRSTKPEVAGSNPAPDTTPAFRRISRVTYDSSRAFCRNCSWNGPYRSTESEALDDVAKHAETCKRSDVFRRKQAESAKANAVQQAKIWAQEARTQRSIVQSLCEIAGIPGPDYEAESRMRVRIAECMQAVPRPARDDVREAFYDFRDGTIDIDEAVRIASEEPQSEMTPEQVHAFLERNTAVSDATRGEPGHVTATEVAIAEAARGFAQGNAAQFREAKP